MVFTYNINTIWKYLNVSLKFLSSIKNRHVEFPAFSCGKLAPGNELRVKDIDTGVDLGPGKIGEFYFRSPYAFAGYFRNSLEVRLV